MVRGMPLLPLSLLMHLDLLKTIGTLLIKTLIDERIRYSTVDQLMQCNAVRKKNPLPRQTREAETDQKDAKHSIFFMKYSAKHSTTTIISMQCSLQHAASPQPAVAVALCQRTASSNHIILEVDYYNASLNEPASLFFLRHILVKGSGLKTRD